MSGIFGGAPAPRPQPMAALPELPKPVVMPQADPVAQRQSAARKLAAQRARVTTREATILGGDDETLG